MGYCVSYVVQRTTLNGNRMSFTHLPWGPWSFRFQKLCTLHSNWLEQHLPWTHGYKVCNLMELHMSHHWVPHTTLRLNVCNYIYANSIIYMACHCCLSLHTLYVIEHHPSILQRASRMHALNQVHCQAMSLVACLEKDSTLWAMARKETILDVVHLVTSL